MKSGDLIGALKGLPEFRLRLIELAWELAGEDGSIDFEKASFYRKETEDAIKEAQGYGRATKEAVRCLRQIGR